jgi:hypothetical protein
MFYLNGIPLFQLAAFSDIRQSSVEVFDGYAVAVSLSAIVMLNERRK